MTEGEWLTSHDPDRLLKWLQKSRRHRPTRRKLGLFACACAQRLGALVPDSFTARGLALAERMAEGNGSQKEVDAFGYESVHVKSDVPYAHIAVWAVRIWEQEANWTSPDGSARSVAGYVAMELGDNEPAEQCRLLRDIVGNPYRRIYRRIDLDPGWLSWNKATVPKLADDIYQQRAFDRLPILADALEDAGCDNADILAHCRGPGPHVRGCWVVDLLLGKE